MTFPRFLAAGLALSFLFHGAGSAYFAKDPNEIEIAASQGGGVSVIGSLEDLVAGSKVEEITPEEPVEEIEPEIEPVEVVQAKPVEVAKAETPVQPQAQPIQAPVAPVVSETVPIVAGVTSIEAVTAETVIQPTPEPEKAELVTTKEVTPPKPVEKVETLQQKPEEIADIKPDLEKAVEVAEPLNPIVKTPPVKPEPLIKEAKLVEKVKPVQEIKPVKHLKPVEKKKKKKNPAKKAKKKGADRNSQKGGSQVTSRTANSNANGRADARTNDGGTKAASNYKGKVFSKVRRAQRYPRKAERKKIQGTVHVSFTVAKTGSVSNIRVVRSSGHAILDKAAADQVRRAAPMPKFPKNIKKTKLAFKARIAFKSRR